MIPIAGAANNARRMVTTNVTKALFHPGTLKPIISTNSRIMGITETNATIIIRRFKVIVLLYHFSSCQIYEKFLRQTHFLAKNCAK
jgi:hypothetical protein